jgi:hypothetical protein
LDSKVRFALDACPLGKWRESDEDWMNGEFDKFMESRKDCCPDDHIPEPPQ